MKTELYVNEILAVKPGDCTDMQCQRHDYGASPSFFIQAPMRRRASSYVTRVFHPNSRFAFELSISLSRPIMATLCLVMVVFM